MMVFIHELPNLQSFNLFDIKYLTTRKNWPSMFTRCCFFISTNLCLDLSFISRPLLFLVIRLMFQTHHIKIYHSTWQSHCHRFTKAFIVAVHLTSANDLRVFLSWPPMRMSTTYRHASFFQSAEAFLPLKSHLIGIMAML